MAVALSSFIHSLFEITMTTTNPHFSYELFGLTAAQVRTGLAAFQPHLKIAPSIAVSQGNLGALLVLASHKGLPTAGSFHWSILAHQGKIFLRVHTQDNSGNPLLLEVLEVDSNGYVLCCVHQTVRKLYIRLHQRGYRGRIHEASAFYSAKPDLFKQFLENKLFDQASSAVAEACMN